MRKTIFRPLVGLVTLALLASLFAGTATAVAPTANAGADQTVFVGQQVQFDGSATQAGAGATIRSYSWNFQDGSKASGVRPTHTYAQAGTYDVVLTVVNSDGETHSDTVRITVQADSTAPTVRHTPVTSGTAGQPIQIRANVTDNVNVTGVTLYYRLASERSYRSLAMSFSQGNYSAQIPGSSVTGNLQYYLTATDAANNLRREPASTATPNYHAISLSDNAAPTIVVDTLPTAVHGQALSVSATISDASGFNATLYYRRDASSAWQQVAFQQAGSKSTASIPWTFLASGTSFQYYVFAEDGSSARNNVTAPTGGRFSPSSGSVEVAPGITHTALAAQSITSGDSIAVSADVADDGTVSSVTAYLRKQAGSYQAVALAANGATWSGSFPASAFQNGASGTYEYYLEATDNESRTTRHPTSGVLSFSVTVSTSSTGSGSTGGGSNTGGGSSTPTDATRPTVGVVTPEGEVDTARPEITAAFSDDRGVSTAEIVLKIDGVPVTPSATGTALTYTPSEDLAPGNHTVTLVLKDAAGNTVTREWTFTVPEPSTEEPSATPDEGNVTTPGGNDDGTPATGDASPDKDETPGEENRDSGDVNPVNEEKPDTPTGDTTEEPTADTKADEPAAKERGGIPGFEAVAALAAIGFAVAVRSTRRRD